VARVHYLLGNIAFHERRPEAGLKDYREALRLDPGYGGDAALLRNLRELIDEKRLGLAALDMLVSAVGKPACPTLAAIASSDRRYDFRHGALDACEFHGCTAEIDRFQLYSLDLAQGKRCEERHEAVQGLRELGDPRALEPLRKMRRRGGGVLGGLFGSDNACLRKDLDAAIKELEAK
jgi:hypothetical protein